MPVYHFNIRNDVDVDDEEGTELPDDGAAREYAIENARVLVCDTIRQRGQVNLDHRLVVTDPQGRLLFEVTYREAFTVVGQQGGAYPPLIATGSAAASEAQAEP